MCEIQLDSCLHVTTRKILIYKWGVKCTQISVKYILAEEKKICFHYRWKKNAYTPLACKQVYILDQGIVLCFSSGLFLEMEKGSEDEC